MEQVKIEPPDVYTELETVEEVVCTTTEDEDEVDDPTTLPAGNVSCIMMEQY